MKTLRDRKKDFIGSMQTATISVVYTSELIEIINSTQSISAFESVRSIYSQLVSDKEYDLALHKKIDNHENEINGYRDRINTLSSVIERTLRSANETDDSKDMNWTDLNTVIHSVLGNDHYALHNHLTTIKIHILNLISRKMKLRIMINKANVERNNTRYNIDNLQKKAEFREAKRERDGRRYKARIRGYKNTIKTLIDSLIEYRASGK